MRGSRGAALIAACVVLAVASLGVPGAAWSASHRARPQRSFSTEVTGPLLIAWSGDPAHGCAAAGLCGVSGTLQMHFGNGELSGSGGPPELMANDDGAVARVQTTAPDGSVTTCVDLVPVQFDIAVHGASARVAGTLLGLGSQAPSAGRCAGPTSSQLAALRLPARRLAHGYDLSGRTSFATGPFAVTVISGVRARITFGGRRTGSAGHRGDHQRRWHERAGQAALRPRGARQPHLSRRPASPARSPPTSPDWRRRNATPWVPAARPGGWCSRSPPAESCGSRARASPTDMSDATARLRTCAAAR